MIKVSDYIVKGLVEHGVRHVFMITGGGAMHLNDSIGKCKEIEYICNHHEQACAIAAEGYARVSGRLGVVNVTTGPGGLNTLTGVMGQWTDSVPVLYISGQVKFETTIASCPETGLRQLGDQEVNIVDVVRPLTKYAVMVTRPEEIGRCLDKAIYLATHGRPGPVWLDVPLDVQGAMIDENTLPEYDEKEDVIIFDRESLRSQVLQTVHLLEKAERPVLVAGHGIRIAGAQELFLEVVRSSHIPVVSTFNGFDLLATDHPQFIGRIGTVGDRAGNFALQNADIVLSVGSRNNIRQISYNWKTYTRAAKRVIVDVDGAELEKPTLRADLAIRADARDFLEELNLQVTNASLPRWENWMKWCLERKMRYPVVLPEYRDISELVNPYYFVKVLSECMTGDAVVVAGNGTACVSMFQAGIVKKCQRIFWNSGCASMGYDLPAAIGACLSNDRRPAICIAGDGSLQMNIQEFQTVANLQLPIKLFVLNNRGYLSIKQTQDAFFDGRHVGCDDTCGISFPDITKVASAYGLNTEVIGSHLDMKEKIRNILGAAGPLVCEVVLTPDYKFSPKLSSERRDDGRIISKPIEDMYPFLDRGEFKDNMLISEWDPEG